MCVSVCVCRFICTMASVYGVRGKLSGVSSLLLPCRFWVIRFGWQGPKHLKGPFVVKIFIPFINKNVDGMMSPRGKRTILMFHFTEAETFH